MTHFSILLVPLLAIAMLTYYKHRLNEVNILGKAYIAKSWRSVNLKALESIEAELYNKNIENFSSNRLLHYAFGISLLLSCFRLETLFLWIIGFTIYKFMIGYEKKNHSKILQDGIHDNLGPLLEIPLSFVYRLFPHLDYSSRYYDATKDSKF